VVVALRTLRNTTVVGGRLTAIVVSLVNGAEFVVEDSDVTNIVTSVT
jgi:hypothetical protein